MPSILNSQSLVLATAMAVSATTIIFFDHFREKYQDSTTDKQVLKSCLSSGSKEKEKTKKRVQFVDDVKDSSGNCEFHREEDGIPENHVSLYSGILKDHMQRMEYS
ncbi:Hypothetical predicted protein [Olea europaea subsp. europaea]|uniref:Uncharacterized protein n=1 Tax=Olea europaea subsp. europaea TaxID=158383 RepID=A0A8S0VND7_OLEEU|nr:Hypothetical predicted protein [Olea europaea subsp. europaea]